MISFHISHLYLESLCLSLSLSLYDYLSLSYAISIYLSWNVNQVGMILKFYFSLLLSFQIM